MHFVLRRYKFPCRYYVLPINLFLKHFKTTVEGLNNLKHEIKIMRSNNKEKE